MNDKDSGSIYHIIRDGVMHMAVSGSELKATDIVESVDDPDSRTQLVADINAWLSGNVGISVWLTDLVEQVRGWLDRQAAITERECAWRWQQIAEDRDRAEVEHGKLQQRVDELEAALAMDSRIRAQQSNCIDNLAKRRDELESQVGKLERINQYGWECECKLQAERDKLKSHVEDVTNDYVKLVKERDSLADDLAECMEERDYWKQEVQCCMDAAYPPSHAPERPYDPRVMAYPDREGCTTPSTLVSEVIDGLRDDVRDTVMPIIEESANAKADCERWRKACGSMMDVAHEIERIMAEMELR